MGRVAKNVIDQIPILYEDLKSKKAVAEVLGISVQLVTKTLMKVNAPEGAVVKERVKITPELIEKINKRYQEVRCMAQVAREFKISSSTVKKYLTEENKELNQKNYDDRDALFYYIYRLFGAEDEEHPVSEWNLILMNRFREQGMPYRGQLLTLKYYYEVKHHKVKEEYKTIGIIKYIWQEAANYYKRQEKNQERILKEIQEQLEKDRIEIPYKPSQYIGRKKKKKKINLNNLEVKNE